MSSLAIAFLLGICTLQLFFIKSHYTLLLLMIIAVFSLYLRCRSRLLVVILVYLLGFLWMQLNITWMQSHKLQRILINKDLVVNGVVVSLPAITGKKIEVSKTENYKSKYYKR